MKTDFVNMLTVCSVAFLASVDILRNFACVVMKLGNSVFANSVMYYCDELSVSLNTLCMHSSCKSAR